MTTPTIRPTSAFALAAAAGSLPRGLHFTPDAPGGTPPAPNGGTPPAPNGGTPPAPNGGTPPAPNGGTPPSGVTQADVDRARSERDALAARVAELQAKINAAPNVTPEDLAELKRFRDEQANIETERKKKEGQFELLIKEQADQHKRETEALKAETAKANARLADSFKVNNLSAIIPKYTGVQPISDVITAVFSSSVTFSHDGSYTIKDDKGEHPIDPTTGRKMELEAFVAREIASRPWCCNVKPSLGSGGSSQGGSGSGVAGQFTPEDIAKMTPAQFKANQAAIMAQVNTRA